MRLNKETRRQTAGPAGAHSATGSPVATSTLRHHVLQELLLLFALLLASAIAKPLHESKRVEEYHRRNYTFPPSNYIPNTDGWRNLFATRLAQVSEMEDMWQRYEGFVQVAPAAHQIPNFTEHGIGLARAPAPLLRDLREAVRRGLDGGEARREGRLDVIDAPEPPLFLDRPDLADRVLRELQPHVEAWSGRRVTPARAYGFRLYQNNSRLRVHVDRPQTHVLSFVLHVDSSDDAEPWPLLVEDFHGRTHEVVLRPGDILFYESSKCFHGRPRRFRGSWYTSLFVHYHPAGSGWDEVDHAREAHYAVPPQWMRRAAPSPSSSHPRLELVGTSLVEPDCPDGWCQREEAVVVTDWRSKAGSLEDHVWIDPNLEKRLLFHPEISLFGE